MTQSDLLPHRGSCPQWQSPHLEDNNTPNISHYTLFVLFSGSNHHNRVTHFEFKNSKLTSSGFVHWSARRPLVLMWIVPLDAGQVRHSVVSTHHKYKSKHHTYSEVDPLICHGGYHFPGILARVIPLHAVYSRRSTVIKTQRLKRSNSPATCNT